MPITGGSSGQYAGMKRRPTLGHLAVLGESGDWEDRASAGEQLAAFAGEPAVDDLLGRLLLDPADTAVTLATALALLARPDPIGLRLVARALALADDDHGDSLGDALTMRSPDERVVLSERFRALHQDTDADVRAGAKEVSDWPWNP
jgi:hypothetical protein